MSQNPVPRPVRSPEVSSASGESGDGDDFNELLQGMLDLTSAEGNVTAVDFIERTLEEMEKMGVGVSDYRIDLILRYGVGTRESVLDRVSYMTVDEFDRAYPGAVGELVRLYLEPVIPAE